MAEYSVDIEWKRSEGEEFIDHKYSRAHSWRFDGGAEVAASSSPDVVPLPYSIAANVDPEEAFVAALSSCHMLWFLHLAAGKKIIVESYRDNAVGIMAKNADGQIAMTEVTLKPDIAFSGNNKPSGEQLNQLHHLAHKNCFIANSVKTVLKIESV